MIPATARRPAESALIADAIRAESAALERLAAGLDDPGCAQRWTAAVDLLTACTGHVVVSGMGKSGLIGAKISATFSSLGQPSSVVHPADAVHGDLGRVRQGDVVLLLSYSGETEEVVNLACILKADGVPRLGISCDDGSSLARLSSVHLALGRVTEACPLNLAPTTSTAAQLAVGDALALALARRRSFTSDDFHRSHPGGLLGARLRRVVEILRFRAGDNLPILPDTLDVRTALERSRAESRGPRRAGALLLVDADGRLSGIFTDGDLRRVILADPAALTQPIRSVMTASPKRLGPASLVRDAERLMREHRIDEIPVTDDDGRPLGLVDVQDLIALRIVAD